MPVGLKEKKCNISDGLETIYWLGADMSISLKTVCLVQKLSEINVHSSILEK